MKNFQEWFSVTELLEKEIGSLPASDKGIVKKQLEKSGKNDKEKELKERLLNIMSILCQQMCKLLWVILNL